MNKVRTITIVPGDETTIKVNIKPAVRDWLLECFKESDYKATSPVYYQALSYLLGITPQAAVKKANVWAVEEGKDRINTRDFCEWLANTLSRFFAESFGR